MKEKKEFSLRHYIWKYKLKFILYIFTLIIAYAASAVSAILTAQALSLLTEAKYDMMLYYVGYATIALLVGRICSVISDCAFGMLIRDISTDIRKDLTQRFFVISSKSFSNNSAGMFVNRLAYSPDEAVNCISELLDLMGNIITALVTIFYIIFLNVYVGLLVCTVVILLIGFEYYRVRIYAKNRTIRKKSHDKVVSFANEVVRSERDIKSLNLEGRLENISNEVYDDFKNKRYKEFITDVKMWSARQFVLEIFSFCLVWFSLYLFENAFIAVAGLIYIAMNRASFTSVVWSSGRIFTKIADLRVEKFRIAQIFDENNYPVEKFGDRDIPEDKFKGEIRFKKVTFSYVDNEFEKLDNLNRETFANKKKRKEFLAKFEQYKKDKAEGKITGTKNTVFKNISFKIPAGKTVAFVGRSGSGKSTILSLIPKIYEVESGSVTIDGVDVKNLSKKTLRENISLVNQFPYIFNESIKENLLMANKDATDDMIKDALKKASLLDFVESLKKGINTVVGENGIKLSGGQKQRLAIARALLKKSKIILFDESTSSLDNFAQEEVRKSIEKLKGMTVVIVAHRLSTIRKADIIFFLDKGKIKGQGTFEELFNKNKDFQEMFVAENLE